MTNLARLALVLAVALTGVTAPKLALCLLVSGSALGCYTVLVLAIPRLRRPTAALLVALARPHNLGKADQ